MRASVAGRETEMCASFTVGQAIFQNMPKLQVSKKFGNCR